MIFDSYYDTYKGVIVYVRIMEGRLKLGDSIKMMYTKKEMLVTEIGYFRPGAFTPCDELLAGDVGYIAAGIKNVRDARVGDTVTLTIIPQKNASGYKKINSMVFFAVFILRRADTGCKRSSRKTSG